MALLKVEIKSKDIIKPSSPTPDHCKTLQLGFVDQFAPPLYTPLIFFYQNPNNQVDHNNKEQMSIILKRSLSETLTHFYPLAGKVVGNLSIDCNDQGAEFYEASVSANLSDVLDNPNPDELLKLLPFPPDTTETSAITGVQINHFSCSGIAISVLIVHKIADGATIAAFVKAWTDRASGTTGQDHVPEVRFDAPTLLPPKDLTLFGGIEKLVSNDKVVTRRIVFDKEKIAMLKKHSIDESRVKPATRVEVVCAFLWRKFIDAARAKPNPPKICYASQAVNLRGIASSPIPENCCGNLFWLGFENAPVLEEVTFPELTSKIRAAAKHIDVNYLKKFETGECLDEIKKNCESAIQGVAESCGFSSLIRFPLYEANFGWGKPIWVSMTTLPLKNSVFLLGTNCGEGVDVWVNILERDVSIFEQDSNGLCVASSTI